MKNQFIALLGLGIFALVGCERNYQIRDLPASANAVTIDAPVQNNAIANHQAVFAIRAANCVLCHGNIQASIITDYGYSENDEENFYFGRRSGTTPIASTASMYGHHLSNLATTVITGDIIIPATTAAPIEGYGSLWDFLLDLVGKSVRPTDSLPSLKPAEKIYIGAPTRDEITDLLPSDKRSGPEPTFHYYGDAGAPPLSGLQVVDGKYVANTEGQTLNCTGDLVVKGMLFLKNLRLKTGNAGCRFYTTRTVFIHGPIEYVLDGPEEGLEHNPNRNLQITSSRAIYMGLGPVSDPNYKTKWGHTNSLTFRTTHARGGWFTRETGSNSAKVTAVQQEIRADANLVPIVDAFDERPYGRSVSFERLLLNAPEIQSRYRGEFRGSLIAEVTLFTLGGFKFSFDPVFTVVEPFPLLPTERILDVSGVTE